MADETPEPSPLTLEQISLGASASKRKDRPSWVTLAISLRALEESSKSVLDPTGTRWSDRVATAAGIGSNQIVKIARAWRFVTELAASGAEIDPPHTYAALPVEVIDIVARYITLEREAALSLLRSRPTYDRARAVYSEAQTAAKKTHARSQNVGYFLQTYFEVRCQRIFSAHKLFWAGIDENDDLRAFFDESVWDEPIPPEIEEKIARRSAFTKTDAIYYQDANHVTAMLCRDFSSATALRAYPAFVREISLKSTFYWRFWIFTSGGIAHDLVADLDFLGLDNVGVMALPMLDYRVDKATGQVAVPPFDVDDLSAQPILRDIKGGPSPDRRPLLFRSPTRYPAS